MTSTFSITLGDLVVNDRPHRNIDTMRAEPEVFDFSSLDIGSVQVIEGDEVSDELELEDSLDEEPAS